MTERPKECLTFGHGQAARVVEMDLPHNWQTAGFPSREAFDEWNAAGAGRAEMDAIVGVRA